MKIVIPMDGPSMENMISRTFGRARYFLIYDTESQQGTFIDNIAAASQGGTGIQAAQIIVDHKADAVLTPQCGENAANVLKLAGINVYKTVTGSAQTALDDFAKGTLSVMEYFHSGYHGGHGGR